MLQELLTPTGNPDVQQVFVNPSFFTRLQELLSTRRSLPGNPDVQQVATHDEDILYLEKFKAEVRQLENDVSKLESFSDDTNCNASGSITEITHKFEHLVEFLHVVTSCPQSSERLPWHRWCWVKSSKIRETLQRLATIFAVVVTFMLMIAIFSGYLMEFTFVELRHIIDHKPHYQELMGLKIQEWAPTFVILQPVIIVVFGMTLNEVWLLVTQSFHRRQLHTCRAYLKVLLQRHSYPQACICFVSFALWLLLLGIGYVSLFTCHTKSYIACVAVSVIVGPCFLPTDRSGEESEELLNFWFGSWSTPKFFITAPWWTVYTGIVITWRYIYHFDTDTFEDSFSFTDLGNPIQFISGVLPILYTGALLGAVQWTLVTAALFFYADVFIHQATKKEDSQFLTHLVVSPSGSTINRENLKDYAIRGCRLPSKFWKVIQGGQLCSKIWKLKGVVIPGISWYLVSLFVFASMLRLYYGRGTHWTLALLIAVMLSNMILLAIFAYSVAPSLRHFFVTFLFAYVMISILVFNVSSMPTAAETDATHAPFVNNAATDSTYQSRWTCNSTVSYSPYPVCSMHWGAPSQTVNVFDLAIIASQTYAANNMVHNEMVRASFIGLKDLTFNDTWLSGNGSLPTVSVTRFSNNKDRESSGTTVIAVKGTSTAVDVLADAGVYASVEVFRWVSLLTPLLDITPNFVIAWILEHFREDRTEEDQLLADVKSQVANVTSTYPHDEIVLTGHSLGGAIAQIVAEDFQVPAVVFSAPGSHFTRYQLNTTMEWAYRNVVGIKPDYDEVPEVDRHDDMVQKIQCRNQEGYRRNPAACHGITTTLCELYRACGDPRQRNYSQTCSSLIDEKSLGCYFYKLGRDV